MNRITNYNQYIVHDFFREINENEEIINNHKYRILVITDKDNIVVCSAVLEKPKNKKNWKYILYWWGNNQTIDILKYVAPFRATEKNRNLFNKKSRHVAKKIIERIEKQNISTYGTIIV